MTDVAPVRTPFVLSERPSKPELVAKCFRALGDPLRVRILELLDEHEKLSVTQLVGRLGHPTVFHRVADESVVQPLALGRALVAGNAEHVAACGRIDGADR